MGTFRRKNILIPLLLLAHFSYGQVVFKKYSEKRIGRITVINGYVDTYTTINASPVIVPLITIPFDRLVTIRTTAICREATFASVLSLDGKATFKRGAVGNIVKVQNTFVSGVEDFTGNPSIDLTPDNISFTVNLELDPLAGTTMYWHLLIDIYIVEP